MPSVFMDDTVQILLLSSMCCTSEMFKALFVFVGKLIVLRHGLEFYLCWLVICPNIGIKMQQMFQTSTALKIMYSITETTFKALRITQCLSWDSCHPCGPELAALLPAAGGHPPWFWEGGDLLYQPWVLLYHTQDAVSLRCSGSSGHLRMSANNKSDSIGWATDGSSVDQTSTLRKE